MSGFETRFGEDDDAEQILAAFYGFVGQHADKVDGDAHISTEIVPFGAKLTVRLWSAEAMAAFLSGLRSADRPDRRARFE